MASWCLALGLACLVVSVVGLPARGQDPQARLYRSPANNGMFVRGYFVRTPSESNMYYPRAAYGIGMAGVGTYYAPRRNNGGCRNCNQVEDELPMAVPEPGAESDPRDEAPEDLPVEDVTDVNLQSAGDSEGGKTPEVEAPKEEETPVPTNAPKPKTPKKSRTPKRRPVEVDVDEDEEEEEVPRKGGRKGDSPSFSNFFPINFGGGAGRSGQGQGQEEGQNPGLIAIANSFSTGRGAVATSHATAFGGLAPAQVTRGSPSRYRS